MIRMLLGMSVFPLYLLQVPNGHDCYPNIQILCGADQCPVPENVESGSLLFCCEIPVIVCPKIQYWCLLALVVHNTTTKWNGFWFIPIIVQDNDYTYPKKMQLVFLCTVFTKIYYHFWKYLFHSLTIKSNVYPLWTTTDLLVGITLHLP